MIGTTVRFLVIVLIALAIPYLWFQEGGVKNFLRAQVQYWTNQTSESSTSDTSLALASATPPQFRGIWEASADTDQSAPPRSVAVARLEELVRFDITDRWVLERWPRVSTILSERHRKGLRVPLVTGSQPNDLAGALSYYFDENGRVRRISFQGHTGDASNLVQVATHRFRMRAEPNLGAGLYLTRWNGLPVSGLRIRHAPVVRETDPLAKLEFFFEVNRPDTGYSLSAEFLELIQTDHLSRR